LLKGRTGREQKPPPQFGQTFSRTLSTQVRQKVHSNVQIIASVQSGGKSLLQFSHVGLSSSIVVFSRLARNRVVGAGAAIRPEGPCFATTAGPVSLRILWRHPFKSE